MKRLLSTFYLFAIATACVMACSSESINEVNDTNDQKVPTAKEWNKGVVGWNLGNQFECSAPGQDGESMAIGMPDNSINLTSAVLTFPRL